MAEVLSFLENLGKCFFLANHITVVIIMVHSHHPGYCVIWWLLLVGSCLLRVATCCVLLLLVCCLLRVVCCVLLVFSAWCLVVFGVCLFVLVVAALAVLAVVDLAGGDCASDPRKNTDKLHAETWQKAHQFPQVQGGTRITQARDLTVTLWPRTLSIC